MPEDEPELTAAEIEALEQEHEELRCRLHGLAWEYLQRSGVLPMGPRPEEEVATRLDLSRRKVRDLTRRGLAKLRKRLLEPPTEPQP